jgi:hypothetical protein
MVIQVALLLAVQLQPAPAVRLTLPLLALDATDALEAEMEYVQGAAAWLRVKVCPAMVKDPDRGLVLVLAAFE